MRERIRRWPIGFKASVALLATAFLTSCSHWQLHETTAVVEWPVFGGGFENSRYSSLASINRNNIGELGAAWMFSFHGEENGGGVAIVHDGVIYVVAGMSLYALDAGTAKLRWEFKSGIALTTRGVSVGDGLVFVGTRDAHLLALDMKTGVAVWQTMIGAEPSRFGQWIAAAPIYLKGLVIVGLANGDFGLRGRMFGVEARTGRVVWSFNTIAQPGEPGGETWPPMSASSNPAYRHGGGVWMTPAYDADLDLIYFGVGNPVPQFGGEVRPGDNLFTSSVVALERTTGHLVWHYQLVRHDIWDHDAATPMVLYDAAIAGRPRKALAAMRTDGFLFLLDRKTGRPIFPVEYRAVPQNGFVKTASTQPFPVGADELGPRCVEADMVPAGFDRDCYFDVIDERPDIMAPVLTARSAPMTFDPDTKRFYVTGTVQPYWMRRGNDPGFFSFATVVPGMRQYGLLAAIDARTNKIAWQTRLPYGVGNGSGVLSTHGGLLFHGHPDGRLLALNAEAGTTLWEFQLGSAANGPAISYAVNGQQYIAIAARAALWAFKLGGAVPQALALPAAPTVTGFQGPIEDTASVEFGAKLHDAGGTGDRSEFDPYTAQPQRIRVDVGAHITFKNPTSLSHHPVAIDGSWDAGEIAPGESKSIALSNAGVSTYICTIHPWTYGEITVEGQ